jgi:hypothetical protein
MCPTNFLEGALRRTQHRIARLGPYQSLVLLAVPTSVVEPLKLAAVAIAGDGHWITGTLVILAAYAGSLLLVERLCNRKAEADDIELVRPPVIWLTGSRVLRRLKGYQGGYHPMGQVGSA